MLIPADLDADINGDTYFTEDDPEETEGLGLVVSVNDDDDGEPEGVDCGNEVIDTPDDRDDMKMLKLRRLKPCFLTSGTARLTVDNTGKIRIFDQDGNVRMAPEDTVAEVPLSQITAGELEYLVEGVDAGQVALTLEYVDDHGNMLDSDMVQITVLDLDLFRDEGCTKVLDDWPEREAEGLLRSPKYYFGRYDPVVVRLRGPSAQGDDCFTVRVKSESSEAGIHLCMKETSPGTYMQKFYLGRTTHAYTEDDDYLLKIVEEEVVDMSVKTSGNEVGVKVDVMVDKGEYASGTGNDTLVPVINENRVYVSNRLYNNMCAYEDGLRWWLAGKMDSMDISELVVNAGSQIAGCEQSDILFVQTHGSYFSLPSQPRPADWANGDLIVVGSMDVDISQRVNVVPESITQEWWNRDLEWIILRVCGALCDYTDTDVWGSPYDKTARDRWIGTIMPRTSQGRTPHGILGYTEGCASAFLDGIDVFYGKLAEGYCLPEAWIYANTHGEYDVFYQPYAVLCHTRNWSDSLTSGTITPDVTDSDFSFAWCHRKEHVGEGLDEFFVTEGRPSSSGNRGNMSTVVKRVPDRPIEVRRVEICRSAMLSARGYRRFVHGGGVSHLSNMDIPDLGNTTEIDCGEKSERFFQDYAHGMPSGAKLASICPLYYSETGKETVTVGYLFVYVHEIGGLEVDGDVIKFTVTEKGVTGYSEKWHEMESQDETTGYGTGLSGNRRSHEPVVPTVSASNALSIAVSSARSDRHPTTDSLNVSSMKQVLRLDGAGTHLRPVYKVVFGSGERVFVDCGTGATEVEGCVGQ